MTARNRKGETGLIKTRFAPSPTGFLHVGGLRTALYNYLFARQHQGRFMLRIEDTDQSRAVPGATQDLIAMLQWAGLTLDEGPHTEGEHGPYIQSQRLHIYQQYIDRLIADGYAYPCFCSPERLEHLRKTQQQRQERVGYDNHCRGLSQEEARTRIANGEAYVIRQKTPLDGEITIEDLIRGPVSFAGHELDDHIIMKSDGYPTYHLANVVDDHLMGITHVIRGEEWLISTPRHKLLYEYLGWELPAFAHLPLLLNQDGSKLSKRQGDVAVEDYRNKGYLPAALINFLALLGWNPGRDQELFTLEELIAEFNLYRVSKSGAVFNPEKLDWMNARYIRNLDPEALYQYAQPFLPAEIPYPPAQVKEILALIQERISRLDEIPRAADFFWSAEIDYSQPESIQVLKHAAAPKVLHSFQEQLRQMDELDATVFLNLVKAIQQETGIKGKALWMTLRVALTGATHGPEIPRIAALLGKSGCLMRVEKTLDYVAKL